MQAPSSRSVSSFTTAPPIRSTYTVAENEGREEKEKRMKEKLKKSARDD